MYQPEGSPIHHFNCVSIYGVILGVKKDNVFCCCWIL